MSKQHLFVISHLADNAEHRWRESRQFFDVDFLCLPQDGFSLQPEDTFGFHDFLSIAKSIRQDDQAFIVGESTEGFFWHLASRLARNSTSFVIIPHHNHAQPLEAYASLLSSQLANARDILFTGSISSKKRFELDNWRCIPLYPFGIDLTLFRSLAASKESLRISLELDPHLQTILYTGRVQSDKNIIKLLFLFAQLKRERQVQLVICYHLYEEEYLEVCRGLAHAIGNVTFVYNPEPNTLVEYYNAADIFVSLSVSIHETFGRSPIEAMACGTPPIVARYNGFRETIPSSCGVLVDTTIDTNSGLKVPDITGFVGAIKNVLDDSSFHKSASRQGIAYARRFDSVVSMEAMAKHLSVIQEIRSISDREIKTKRLCLSGYPKQIQDLWSQLEGEDLESLAADLIDTRRIPIKLSGESISAFQGFILGHF